MTHSPAKYVIFDMDGLLLDTESIYIKGSTQVAAKYGKTYTWETNQAKLGKVPMDVARIVIDLLELPLTPTEFLTERAQIVHPLLATCQPLPGAVELVTKLHEAGIPIAVGTSSSQEMFELKTQNHQELFLMFDTIVTSSDSQVVNGKPAPDIFLTASKQIGANPMQTLVFEDSPAGIQAGVAAGMRVVAVPDPRIDPDLVEDAYMVLESLTKFDAGAFGLV